jgi:hypothetical protein
VTDRWFSLVTPVSSTNKTDGLDITEVLLKPYPRLQVNVNLLQQDIHDFDFGRV